MPKTSLVLAKYLTVFFILVSTFANVSSMFKLFDNKLGKVLLLLVILSAMYYDTHLGVLLLIAFFMLVIQFNAPLIIAISPTSGEEDTKTSKNHESIVTNQVGGRPSYTRIVNEQAPSCENKKKTVTNDGILEYNLDPKVSPFKSYIMNMTSAEQLEKASNDAFLQG